MESQGNGIREPLRSSRWSPKPEQIMILESIFNSGMVNPPRHEATRIRNLLERFGPVADANVFYWFQNRRSRYRRLQRQNLFGSNSSVNSTTAPSIDSDVITVFINGVEREIRRGCVHVRSVLGGDFTIYDSSGVVVEVNEHGYLLRSLQEGQTYSLVQRNS